MGQQSGDPVVCLERMIMAYNYYPAGYQYYPQYQQNNQQSGIIWVQGEAGAKSYMVAPNTTVQLWDSDENVIYIKSADASGMPSMKVLDYTIRETSESKNKINNHADFVTKDEVAKEIKRLENLINSLKASCDGEQVR
jgi:hypothetical protein